MTEYKPRINICQMCHGMGRFKKYCCPNCGGTGCRVVNKVKKKDYYGCGY